MLLFVQASADGDQYLSGLIRRAMVENSEGWQFIGKVDRAVEAGAEAVVQMVGYAQVMDFPDFQEREGWT